MLSYQGLHCKLQIQREFRGFAWIPIWDQNYLIFMWIFIKENEVKSENGPPHSPLYIWTPLPKSLDLPLTVYTKIWNFWNKIDFFFYLILNIPVNNFSVMSIWVFLGWTSTKQGLICLAQGHNTVTPVRLEPRTLRSRVNHSTTEPLCSQKNTASFNTKAHLFLFHKPWCESTKTIGS